MWLSPTRPGFESRRGNIFCIPCIPLDIQPMHTTHNTETQGVYSSVVEQLIAAQQVGGSNPPAPLSFWVLSSVAWLKSWIESNTSFAIFDFKKLYFRRESNSRPPVCETGVITDYTTETTALTCLNFIVQNPTNCHIPTNFSPRRKDPVALPPGLCIFHEMLTIPNIWRSRFLSGV